MTPEDDETLIDRIQREKLAQPNLEAYPAHVERPLIRRMPPPETMTTDTLTGAVARTADWLDLLGTEMRSRQR